MGSKGEIWFNVKIIMYRLLLDIEFLVVLLYILFRHDTSNNTRMTKSTKDRNYRNCGKLAFIQVLRQLSHVLISS